MRMDVNHPDAFDVKSVLLDGEDVLAVEIDTEEGWARCFVSENGGEPAKSGGAGGVKMFCGEPLVRKFEGQVEVVWCE